MTKTHEVLFEKFVVAQLVWSLFEICATRKIVTVFAAACHWTNYTLSILKGEIQPRTGHEAAER
jgi:hypothetical protein